MNLKKECPHLIGRADYKEFVKNFEKKEKHLNKLRKIRKNGIK